MDNLEKALKFTLRYEGGYVNHPNDPGGETNKGVTKAVYDAYRTKKGLPKQSVKLISDVEVHDIYCTQYWLAAKCDKLDVKLAIAVFDFAVNSGVSRALKYLALAKNDPIVLINLRDQYFDKICKANPKLLSFIKGWKNRTTALREYLKSC